MLEQDVYFVSYWRYVDDIWGLWEHGQEEVKEFHQLTNTLHPQIKTELRYAQKMIEFLVVDVILENERIKTDLCTKNTDKYQYLPATSCHPNSVKRAIPYGLGVLAKRICSSDKDYKTRRNEIKTHLQNRGYRSSLIEEQLQKVDELNREDLLQYKDRKENDRVPLVFTYSKALPNIHAFLRKHLKILHQSNRLKKIFSDPPIVSLKT